MGRLIVVRREVAVVDDAAVASVVGIVMTVIVGRVIVSDDDGGDVVADELGVDDELVDELEVDEDEVDVELVEVDPELVRVPTPTVTPLLRSTVTSGNWTTLVPGIVLDSCGAVDEGKTSVREPPPGLTTWRTATTARTASRASGIALFSMGSSPNVP